MICTSIGVLNLYFTWWEKKKDKIELQITLKHQLEILLHTLEKFFIKADVLW